MSVAARTVVVMMCFMVDPFSWLVSLMAFCLMLLTTSAGWCFFQGTDFFNFFLVYHWKEPGFVEY